MNLLRIYQRLKDGLDGSRIYQLDRERGNLAQWIKEAVKQVSSRNPEISMVQGSVKILSRRQRAQENSSMVRRVVEVSIEAEERNLDRNGICRA